MEGVGLLRLDLVLQGRVVDARGAVVEALLALLRLEGLGLVLAGGDDEGLGDLGRIGALVDRLLERQGALGVVRGRDDRVDQALEPPGRERGGRRAGPGPPERLERVEQGRRVLRAIRGLLAEQIEHEEVELLRHPPARRLGARRLGLLREVGEGGVGPVLGGEDGLARHELVDHRAERVEIRSRVPEPPAHDLGRDGLLRAVDEERTAVPVRRDGSVTEPIGGEVDQRHPEALGAGLPGGAADEDVLELEIAVDQLLLVQRGERLDDAAQDGLELVDVRGPGAREALRQRLPVHELVGHVVGAARQLARLDALREALVRHARDEPVVREEARHRAAVPRDVAAQDLDHVRPVVALREVHHPYPALAELLLDGEGPDRFPRRDLDPGEQRPDVAHARVDLAAGHGHHVDERLHAVVPDAPLGERPRERGLRGGAADVLRRRAPGGARSSTSAHPE